MATTTTNMGLTLPGLMDLADVAVLNSNMVKLDGHRHSGGVDGLPVRAVQAGPEANLPLTGQAGQLYVATDVAKLYIHNGTAWGPAASGEVEVVAKSTTVPNGATVAFNIGTGVAASKVEVRKNGLIKVEGDDYTFTPGSAMVTFVSPPLTGDVVVMKYVARTS